MACTTFNCPSCGIGYSGSCCPTCQPANSIYQGECADPGTLTIGRFLNVLDYKFCERRLTNAPGFLTANVNGSGNYGIGFTTTPQVQLDEVVALEGTAFGNLIVMGSDYRWRALQAPSTLGLYLQTDANGNMFFGDPPAAVVPDDLAIENLNVADTATFNDVVTNGTVTLNNIASGTVVNLLGLDVSNELVLQALTAGIAGIMFYEAATSPSAAAPNKSKANGENLVIGNELFDSGANLINVFTSESLKVAVAGKYALIWVGTCQMGLNSKAAISLMVNNVMVNNAGRTDTEIGTSSAARAIAPFTGIEMRSLAVNDVLNLQLNSSGTVNTFNVRLIAIKFAD